MQTKRWSVDIYIDEIRGDAHAKASLFTGGRTSVQGKGLARLYTSDPSIPEIGEEIAAARALIDLGHRLLELAGADVTDRTGEPPTPRYPVQAWLWI